MRRTIDALLGEKGVVSPLDLFLKLEKISPKLIEDWRFGRVPYLERVLQGGLGQLSFIMSTLREVARERGLKPSYTAYKRWGKGPKQPLRFSKFGDPNVERHYATHYVANKPKSSMQPVMMEGAGAADAEIEAGT